VNDDKTSDWLDKRARQTLAENGFEPRFSAQATSELLSIESETTQTAENGIADLRHLLWSSVDNESSRDLDQVEYAERLDDGDIRILVGIADVDHFVTKDSALDRHAAQNTVSIYTPTETFPMLPVELSTGLTSLNENEDRMAVVVELVIKENGDVPGNNVYRAFVRNRAKLDYESVGRWLDENARVPTQFASTPGLKEQIELQVEAAERLHKFRLEKGALEFESIESAPVMENGRIQGIVSVKDNSARKLVENFMIAANVEMAEFLDGHGYDSIRRVVKSPEHWEGICEIAAKHKTALPETPDARALAEFLTDQRKSDPMHFPDLSLAIIKLIGSGEYVVQQPNEESDGHFGLGVRDYAHSTAPNRRFPDIVVQRLVKAAIAGAPQPYSREELVQIAEHCNDRERAARKVERKMRKVVAATVMKRHVGESFDAIVTGVTDRGTFARVLRPPVDGRIVRGERGLKLGQKIDVRLLSADPQKGFIDFAAQR
jgi:exoribonuclease-2